MAGRTKLNDMIKVPDIRPHAQPGATVEVTVRDHLMTMIRMCVPQRTAALNCGIDETTFYRWAAKGKKAKSGQWYEFYLALESAQAHAHAGLVVQVRIHAKSDARTAMWMLERRFSDDWQERKAIDTTLRTPEGAPPVLVHQLQGMTAEQLAALSGCDLDDQDGLRLPSAATELEILPVEPDE